MTDPAAERMPLPPDAGSVSTARRWLRDRLAGWPPDASEAAVLALSELVTNVVLHAHTAMEVVLETGEGRVRVEVVDRSSVGTAETWVKAESATVPLTRRTSAPPTWRRSTFIAIVSRAPSAGCR